MIAKYFNESGLKMCFKPYKNHKFI